MGTLRGTVGTVADPEDLFAGPLQACAAALSEAAASCPDHVGREAARIPGAAADGPGPGDAAAFAPSVLETSRPGCPGHLTKAIQAGLRGRVAVLPSEGKRLIATDGSLSAAHSFPAWGYIASTGEWGCAAAAQPMPPETLGGNMVVLVAEVCAVGMALRDISGPATFLIDSLRAIELLRAWQAGTWPASPAGRQTSPVRRPHRSDSKGERAAAVSR
jgi:hypothetical protein